MSRLRNALLGSAALCAVAIGAGAAPQFQVNTQLIERYEYVEITATARSIGGNPFVDARFTGELLYANETPLAVNGFCDSPDGSVFRIRFLATRAGAYRFRVKLEDGAESGAFEGTFTARESGRRGLVRVDPRHPFHFLWEGTGEHYFWNGLTTYALLGWQDEAEIRAVIDRAARWKVNRLRVTLNGPRVSDASRWYEPVKPSNRFHFLFGPWVGAHPDVVNDPGWDVTRYDTAFWQKCERTVRYARDRDVVISIIFFLDGEDKGADPFGKERALSEDEKRYYRYAAARLAGYSNVMWDVTNEWHLFRTAWWVQQMGTYLKAMDPWKHLVSCHGREDFPWRVSFWPDFSMFQLWDEAGGYEPMLARRKAQAETGRPMPQINEEYGYEDHYPVKWGGNRRPPARSADNRRRQAWEITMAGCYQTTGERANNGNGQAPATPGGWINGGFDSSMHMPEAFSRLVQFFTSFEYWKLEPTEATGQIRILAERGRRYVIYFPDANSRGSTAIDEGTYTARWYNPRSGDWSTTAEVTVKEAQWHAPSAPPGDPAGDWALLLERR